MILEGFAVLAAEVCTLAQRSTQDSRAIKALISKSVDEVENIAKLVGDAATPAAR